MKQKILIRSKSVTSESICINSYCRKAYNIDPKLDAIDRNYCPECLRKEYKQLYSIYNRGEDTKSWDKPAGKRIRPKSKKGTRRTKKAKRIYYRDFIE